ncbi:DUF4810 domain-containing protein [Methylolobus aquaticus]
MSKRDRPAAQRGAKRALRAIWLLAASVFDTGCAPKTLYNWGGYEDSLYLRYTAQDFTQAETEAAGTLPTTAHPLRVPPGVYADYGFLLYRRGDYARAIQYFEKEKATYPESSLLMTRLIDRVRQRTEGKSGISLNTPPAAGGSGP